MAATILCITHVSEAAQGELAPFRKVSLTEAEEQPGAVRRSTGALLRSRMADELIVTWELALKRLLFQMDVLQKAAQERFDLLDRTSESLEKWELVRDLHLIDQEISATEAKAEMLKALLGRSEPELNDHGSV